MVQGPWWAAAIVLSSVCGPAPRAEARSSSRTIGVQIVVPERPAAPSAPDAVPSRSDGLLPPPDGSPAEWTATRVPQGDTVTILYTAAPTL